MSFLPDIEQPAPEFTPGALRKRFVLPPFSLLDTRADYWSDRRAAWLALGIQSELGRGLTSGNTAIPTSGSAGERARKIGAARAYRVDLMRGEQATPGQRVGLPRDNGGSGYQQVGAGWAGDRADVDAYGTSVFDPVLCELMYRWFAPAGGSVLDPFAGGSVRGIVAASLGHAYTGVDLSAPQVEANYGQLRQMRDDGILAPQLPDPTWHVGDSTDLDAVLPAGATYDLVFTCPPYYDLEVYSDDPADLSAMDTYEAFLDAYYRIMLAASARLAPGRFLVYVVSEIRGTDGRYRGLVPDTVATARECGLGYYNELVLVNSAGSLPLRTEQHFRGTRKIGRQHQLVLVFLKGDPPRDWDHERPAPPTPQLPLPLDVQPASAVPQVDQATPHVVPQLADLTPVTQVAVSIWCKRDDLYADGQATGGKARTIARLLDAAQPSVVVTAAGRHSVQIGVVARAAQQRDLGCVVYVPTGPDTPETRLVTDAGGQLVQVSPGYTNVLQARARDAVARTPGALLVPWGMEDPAHVRATAEQVASLVGPVTAGDVRRVVVPVGSGMSLAGVLAGLHDHQLAVPVLGVAVGAEPTDRLDRWVPGWRDRVRLVRSELPYEVPAADTWLGAVNLDPYYEAKCLPYLEPGDLLWIVGRRPGGQPPVWVCDSCGKPLPGGRVVPSADDPDVGQAPCLGCGEEVRTFRLGTPDRRAQ